MPSRSLRRQHIAALVAAAGLTLAILGEVLSNHQIVAVGYVGLITGVVGLIITSARQATADREAIEAQAFAQALDILVHGELDRTTPNRNSAS